MQGIIMKGITKDFSGKLALNHVDLEIKKGTVHAIVGENGAGKSTLMNILSGALEPTLGEITIDGRKAELKGPEDADKYGIGMVYQHFMLIPVLKVWQNVILGIEPVKFGRRIDKQSAIRRIRETCETYHLDINPEQVVGTMAVGEQQRVEILKVMLRQAEYIILDEPTAVLTPQETEALCENIMALKAMGKTIIFISHKLEEVMGVADEITVLRLGQKIDTIPVSEATPDLLIQMMVGREVHTTGYPVRTEPRDEVLSIEDLHTARSQFTAGLQGISLRLRKGEVLGIAGVDGNGQTELVDAILGMLRASRGQIRKDGKNITNAPASRIRKSGVALIPPDRQTQGLVMNSSIVMNTALGCETDPRICRHGVLTKKGIAGQIPPLLQDYDVRMPSLEAKVSELSGGNQQKVILAREFGLRNADLVLAVNPTRGLDVGAIEFVYEQIEAQKKAGKAILLISTELSEILRLSDQIAVMFKGKCMGIMARENADVAEIGRLMMGLTGEEVPE